MKNEKTNAVRILEQNKVSYEFVSYECKEAIDGVSVAQKLGVDDSIVFKTLVTQGKTKSFYVFVVPAASELDLKKAAACVGEKTVEMIHVKDINKVTGYVRGGCSPVGMKKQYVTVFDRSACEKDYIFVSAGKIGCQMKVSPTELCKIIGGKFEDITRSLH